MRSEMTRPSTRPAGPASGAHGAEHEPVMLAETLEALAPRPGERVIDGTAGLGGHSRALLKAIAPGGELIAMDRDPRALRIARARLSAMPDPCRSTATVRFWLGEFGGAGQAAGEAGWVDGADAILFDLGVSSMQLDAPDRGFSFLRDGPLDMRMNPDAGMSAAEWLAWVDEEELARVIRAYGDEPRARKIARKIAAERRRRPITTTKELARLVSAAVGGLRGRRHPATRTFQAVRMAVNDEAGALRRGLDAARAALAPGGRLAVISFHSGEDRQVKQAFAEWTRTNWGACLWAGARRPGLEERLANRRARSAKLRAFRRRRRGENGDGP